MKTQLEEEVKAVINEAYKAEYVGTLNVTQLTGGYLLKLGMNKDERPISIAFEGSKDEFINYLK